MHTRRLIIAAVATGALLLAGCASPSGSDSGEPSSPGNDSGIAIPADIAEAGEINVGVYFNYPPYTFEENGELQGIEADLMRAVGETLGLEVNFNDLAFEAMIPSVINGRMDVLVGPLADTPDRREQVSFIDFLTTKMQALVKTGNPTGFDIADPCGARGGEVSASNNLETVEALSEECVAEGEDPIDPILSLPDAGNVFQAVINDRTDFTLQDPALATYMVETTPELELQGDPIPSANSSLEGWVIAKDDEEIAAMFIAAINQLIEDGTWGQILEEGGLTDAALPGPLLNGEEFTG